MSDESFLDRLTATHLTVTRPRANWSIDADPINADWLALTHYLTEVLGMAPEEIGETPVEGLRKFHTEMIAYHEGRSELAGDASSPVTINAEDLTSPQAILDAIESALLDDG